MNITQENTNQLTTRLKVQLSPEDYQEKVEKALKDLQRKAQMPGFRPGKVPMGMVKKLYGKSVVAEEVNKILVDAVYDYVKEKDINMLGNPLPDHEKAREIDWENQKEFEFHYEIGIAPEINLNLADNIEVQYHKIKVEDNIINETIKDLSRRYGKMISPEKSEKEDVLYGKFEELDGESNVIEDGLKNESNLYIQYLKDDDAKEKLTGLKAGDTVDIDLVKALDNQTELASMLGVKKEELDQYGKNYRFVVERISRIEPAELNEELYKKVAPDKEIKDEAQFRDFIGEQLSKQYQVDADKHFKNEAIKTLVEKANLSLPEDFLKRWILESNKENKEITPEQVENEFVTYADSFKWQLIENHLIKEHKIEVSHDEVSNHLKSFMRQQMAQYGQSDPDDDTLNDFVKRIASNQEELKKVYDQLFDVKVMDLLKENLKLKEKEINFDDFVKEMTEKYKNQDQPQIQ
ncbi:MAG: trigger factor [Bacteroidetes bacterium]|nr:MAG: trigger factor [Bacteroidota bacterium]